MLSTPPSLLQRLRTEPDQLSWRRLVNLYTPLIRSTLNRFGVQAADADDLTQEVFSFLLQGLRDFEHNGRQGAFRNWLRQVVLNRLRNHWRQPRLSCPSERELTEFEDDSSDLTTLWDREHDEHVTRKLLELLEPEFAASTWESFCRQVFDNARPVDIAASLGVSVAAVRMAKSRVLRRLRKEIEGLIL